MWFSLVAAVLCCAVCFGCRGPSSSARTNTDADVRDGLDVELDAADPADQADSGDAEPTDADGRSPDSASDATENDTGDTEPVPWTDGRCNGATALCELRYDEVVYATSHNAMSTEADGWALPNHTVSTQRQLELGVRAFMLDVYDLGERAMLCHGECSIGRRSLIDALRELREFLRAHPGEVFTIIFEMYASPDRVHDAFVLSGLDAYLHVQPVGAPWPTLREMVEADRRLVVFTDADAGAFEGYHDVWAHCWDTDWDNQRVEDFDCEPLRGSPDNPLFILNHFLTNPVASPDLAAEANANPLLVDRARQCEAEAAQRPNFVTVDFVSVGDVFEAVDMLNTAP